MLDWKLKVLSLGRTIDTATNLPTGDTHVRAEFTYGDRNDLIKSVRTHLESRGLDFFDSANETEVLWIVATDTEVLSRARVRLDFAMPGINVPKNRYSCTIVGHLPEEYDHLLDRGVYLQLQEP